MADAGKIRIAAHVEVAWLDKQMGEQAAAARCPNCTAAGAARPFLEIDYRPPGDAHFFILHVCGHCGARFADNPETMDYSSDELIEIGWHTYQIQLGAGVWPITAPLTRIDKPAGARMLEIGGAYGFGLDFGIRAKGWRGRGYDPSPLAEFGKRELGLDIVQGYFGADDLPEDGAGGAYDVVLATEVVEHLADPPAFFQLMRAAVGGDGILLLTTPDAAWITPELPAAALMPLLSPGAHIVLQTAESLEYALREAGFAQVLIKREAMSLIAYASPAPFALLEDAGAGRALYRRYLVERAATAAESSDLRLGFAGRGLFEAANDGDAGPAEAAWAALVPAVRLRFGIDLDSIDDLPPAAEGASLAALGRLMPLGLGMILFGRAMQRLGGGAARGDLLPLFRLAVRAIDALQGALAQRSLGDGLSADLRRAAEVEILICQADAGDAAVVAPLVALMARGPGRIVAAWRGLVGLVNAGAYDAASNLRRELVLDEPAAGLPADLRRDALMSLANLALAPGGDTMRAFEHAAALEAMGEPADDIVLQAFTRLVNASRYDEALAAAASEDFGARLARAATREAGRDARLAQMVLDLSAGDPADIPARLEGLPLEPARREALLLEAFIRLVNQSRHQEALAFIRDHDIPALAARAQGDVAQNAGIARMVLDLSAGDPAAIPGRLAGLALEPAQRDALLLQAFIRLVNASRYDEALAFIRDHDIPRLAEAATPVARRDTRLALLVIDLAAGDPLDVPGRLEGLGLEQARGEVLLLEAFVRLVNASRFEDAAAYAAAHEVPALAVRHGGEAGRNAVIALAVMDLATGDPAAVPGRLALLPVAPARAEALRFGAFTGLVNRGRYAEAAALAENEGIMGRLAAADGPAADGLAASGPAADDARVAAVLLAFSQGRTEDAVALLAVLDAAGGAPATTARLYVDGFVRLVNESRFAQARRLAANRALARRLPQCPPELQHDAAAAALMLELQPGGDAQRVPQLVEEAMRAGLEEARLQTLALAAFVTLVNAGEFSTAQLLRHLVDPVLVKLRPPYDEAARNGLFAAGVLALQEKEDWRRGVALFVRLRDALVKLAPPGGAADPLFWPALRGEVLILHRLDRGAEATGLLREFTAVYTDAPVDLRQQLELAQ